MLFFCGHTNLAKSDILRGYIDWHCHLLLGVDDGVQTPDETLIVSAFYEEAGVK